MTDRLIRLAGGVDPQVLAKLCDAEMATRKRQKERQMSNRLWQNLHTGKYGGQVKIQDGTEVLPEQDTRSGIEMVYTQTQVAFNNALPSELAYPVIEKIDRQEELTGQLTAGSKLLVHIILKIGSYAGIFTDLTANPDPMFAVVSFELPVKPGAIEVADSGYVTFEAAAKACPGAINAPRAASAKKKGKAHK